MRTTKKASKEEETTVIKYELGQKIRATRTIIEEPGMSAGDPEAKFPSSQYIHAIEGEEGTVVHIDESNNPTVRFSRTGTATVVAPSEIVELTLSSTK